MHAGRIHHCNKRARQDLPTCFHLPVILSGAAQPKDPYHHEDLNVLVILNEESASQCGFAVKDLAFCNHFENGSTFPQHCRTLFPVPPKKDNLFKLFLAQIRRIPRGKVATYGDIAYAAGYPGYARQVAWALHGGGSSVPWQRVVGSGGKILLTGEHGFEQRFCLEAEGVRLIGLHVDMKAHHHSFFKKQASQPKKKQTAFSLTKKPVNSAAKNAKKKTTPKRRVPAKQRHRK